MKENYEEKYIRAVKETLRHHYETLLRLIKDTASGDHRHLTARNKKEVEGAMYHVVSAYHLALSSDSLITMRAVDSAFAGALFVGMRCSNPLNVKKFWDLKDRGLGGKTTAILMKHDREIVDDWLRDEIARMKKENKGELPAAEAARRIDERPRKSLPVNLPWKKGSQRFVRTISRLMKPAKVEDNRKSIRLVKG
jgi:hypothetical protein